MVEITRILIADHDEAFLRCTAKLLSEEGYVCDYFKSADEAILLFLSPHKYSLKPRH